MKCQLLKSVSMTLLFVGSLFAQDITVEGTGWGETENQALMNAKQDALAKGIGQVLVSETETENFMIKKDMILTKTMGNIKKVDILNKSQGPDGAWELKVRALVSKDGITKDLAALMILRESVGNPRIAMLITENNIGNEDPTAQKTETILIDFFKQNQFEVVDPSYALKFRESPEGIKAMGGDADAAARLGAELNAEVMIIGSVVSKESDVQAIGAFKNSGMKSASATVSLKAVNVSTRRIMTAKTIDAPAVHVNVHTAGNKAIENAVNKLLGKQGGFFSGMVSSWQSTASDGAMIQVEIKGIPSFKHAKMVRESLAPKVKKADQRGFKQPVLKLDVVFQGSVEDFCEIVDGLAIGDSGKSLAVESYEGSNVIMSVK
jgi:curli biogenesis system outer membrane secretion channel CsgG